MRFKEQNMSHTRAVPLYLVHGPKLATLLGNFGVKICDKFLCQVLELKTRLVTNISRPQTYTYLSKCEHWKTLHHTIKDPGRADFQEHLVGIRQGPTDLQGYLRETQDKHQSILTTKNEKTHVAQNHKEEFNSVLYVYFSACQKWEKTYDTKTKLNQTKPYGWNGKSRIR